jgi:hypothetical protein
MRKTTYLNPEIDYAFFLVTRCFFRSQITLRMQFSDLFSLKIKNQGVTEYVSLVATIAFGNTNQHKKIKYGFAVRHLQVEICSIGALATNIFSRFHYKNEPFPNFTSSDIWYETCVVKGDVPFTQVRYSTSTQYKAYTLKHLEE